MVEKVGQLMQWRQMAAELVAMGYPALELPSIRSWFMNMDSETFSWIQFGQALCNASNSDKLAFQVWTAWHKSADPDQFDLAYHLILWRQFSELVSN